MADGWERYFRELVARKTVTRRDNEVVIRAESFADGVLCGDTLAAPTSTTGYAIVDTDLVNFSLVGP